MPEITVTIDRLEWVESFTEEVATPLGRAQVLVRPCQSFRAWLHVGPLRDHWHYFQPAAVADRMHGYELADELAAVESLVREVVFSWAPHLEPRDPTDRRHVHGGQDERIAVAWSPAARQAAAGVLEPHLPKIQAAHAEQALRFAAPPPVVVSDE